MISGRLDNRVTIQNLSTERLPSGQLKEKWHDIATVWAEIKGLSGREILTSGSEKAEATIRVWTRYRDDIGSSSRLRCESGGYKGLILHVVSPPNPDIRNDRLEILCKQGVLSDRSQP